MAGGPSASAPNALVAWNSPRELVRAVLLLSIPVAATNLLQSLVGFVDTRMVSSLGEAALPALGVGRSSMFFTSSIFMGLGVGIVAYVSRMIGAGDPERGREYATVGLWTSVVIGILIMLIGLLIGPGPVHQMVTSAREGVDLGLQEQTRHFAWDFMRIMFFGMFAVGAQFAIVSVFNAVGRTMFPLWLLVITNVVNFIGNCLLIPAEFMPAHWPLPHFEVAGSAWSTTVTTIVTSAVGVMMLLRQRGIVWDLRRLSAPLAMAWEMLKLGFPVSLQVVVRSGSMLILLKLITLLPNSVVGQGALQVGLQVESMAFLPAFAFSTAVATLAGQNLGAGRPDKARLSAYYCLAGSQIIMWSIGIAQYIWAEAFVRLFIGDNAPEVIGPAADYVRILALCLPGLGVGLTFMGVLRGSGDTKITAWITLGAIVLARLPLAIFMSQSDFLGALKMMWLHMWSHGEQVDFQMSASGFGLGMGLDGLWWAMTITVYLEAALAYMRFRGGAWARVRLDQPQRRATDALRPPLAPRLPAAGDLAEEPLEQLAATQMPLPEGELPPEDERRRYAGSPDEQ
ncbi:MATE family efflux transporter [bacterium]|nr:MATE family efflux transporter [bacterium]